MRAAVEIALSSDRLLTSHQASSLLQVDPSTIANWVKAGRLSAFRTPGGHLRIRAGELLRFARSHEMVVPEPLRRLGRARLLVASADRELTRALRRLLRSHADRVEIEAAEHPYDALLELGRAPPHVLLVDPALPGLELRQLERALRVRESTRDVRVVVLGQPEPGSGGAEVGGPRSPAAQVDALLSELAAAIADEARG
jgi:excisionase family DNA binding protein